MSDSTYSTSIRSIEWYAVTAILCALTGVCFFSCDKHQITLECNEDAIASLVLADDPQALLPTVSPDGKLGYFIGGGVNYSIHLQEDWITGSTGPFIVDSGLSKGVDLLISDSAIFWSNASGQLWKKNLKPLLDTECIRCDAALRNPAIISRSAEETQIVVLDESALSWLVLNSQGGELRSLTLTGLEGRGVDYIIAAGDRLLATSHGNDGIWDIVFLDQAGALEEVFIADAGAQVLDLEWKPSSESVVWVTRLGVFERQVGKKNIECLIETCVSNIVTSISVSAEPPGLLFGQRRDSLLAEDLIMRSEEIHFLPVESDVSIPLLP